MENVFGSIEVLLFLYVIRSLGVGQVHNSCVSHIDCIYILVNFSLLRMVYISEKENGLADEIQNSAIEVIYHPNHRVTPQSIDQTQIPQEIKSPSC